MKKSISILSGKGTVLMIKRIFVGLLFVQLIVLPGSGDENSRELTVCYTNSLNGYLDYCKCKDEPKGGLVKRSTVIKKLRKTFGSILLFETGDFFHFENDKLLARYIIEAYRHIGYDGILFGDQEFGIGVDAFLAMKHKLPFLCNNLTVKGKKPPWPRYRIITRKGIRIGVIGTISKDAFRYYSRTIVSRLVVSNQAWEIKNDIARLKAKGIEYIILLSHSGYETDRKLAAGIPGIDLIIGGHSQTLLKKPVRVGETVIVQAGSNGARIGILRAVFNKGRIVSYRNSFQRPDEWHPADDQVIRKLINNYSIDLKKKYKGLRFNK